MHVQRFLEKLGTKSLKMDIFWHKMKTKKIDQQSVSYLVDRKVNYLPTYKLCR